MKRIIVPLLIAGAGLFVSNRLHAQVSISLHIGNQPAWAPEGYDDAQSHYIR